MAGSTSRIAKQELRKTIRDRYQASSRKDNNRSLDEFITVTGYHRKHGVRLPGPVGGKDQGFGVNGRRINNQAVREAVILVWETLARIYDKRLKAALPHLIEHMERHGHLDLDA